MAREAFPCFRRAVVSIDIVYRGELRCEAEHGPSKARLISDAPLDNQGRAESFSPTDLVATALGTCMLTIMGIRAKKHRLSIEGTRVRVEKEMSSEGPRRIVRLRVQLRVANGAGLDPATREMLEEAAHTCPVRLSIHDTIDVPVTFEWLTQG